MLTFNQCLAWCHTFFSLAQGALKTLRQHNGTWPSRSWQNDSSPNGCTQGGFIPIAAGVPAPNTKINVMHVIAYMHTCTHVYMCIYIYTLVVTCCRVADFREIRLFLKLRLLRQDKTRLIAFAGFNLFCLPILIIPILGKVEADVPLSTLLIRFYPAKLMEYVMGHSWQGNPASQNSNITHCHVSISCWKLGPVRHDRSCSCGNKLFDDLV